MSASGPELPRARRRYRALRVRLLRPAYRLGYRLLQVVEFAGATRSRGVKCLLTHRGDVVLVRHTYGPRDIWHVPGGGAHRGESLREAADREMKEELGLGGLSWSELAPVPIRRGRRRVSIPCLQAELAGPELSPDAAEIAEARLFAPDRPPPNLGAEDRGLVAALTERPS